MRKITKERIAKLEENSDYHNKFMYETSKNLYMLLDYLDLEIEIMPENRVIHTKKKRKETGK